jgi:hypothetical protein
LHTTPHSSHVWFGTLLRKLKFFVAKFFQNEIFTLR